VFFPAQPRGRDAGTPLRIGAVGRLTRQKGFDVLIAALPAVLSEQAVELVIVGEGEEEVRLREAARGLPVTVQRFLDGPPAVADFLRSLDVFVMASRYEGLPNVVLEALACGVPVVATDAPGVQEATASRAVLVRAEDASALACGILDTLRRPMHDAVRTRSFADVAEDHLAVFDAARAGSDRTLPVSG
jgi:glycosyltransferase involved in cell wall biosynthesis